MQAFSLQMRGKGPVISDINLEVHPLINSIWKKPHCIVHTQQLPPWLYVLKERFAVFVDYLELHLCGLHESLLFSRSRKNIYPTLTYPSKNNNSLYNVPPKGAFIAKANFPLERRFWDFARTVPNSYAFLLWPNQFRTFSAHFVRNVCGHFGFIWPVTKCNIFGFIEPHITT